MSLILGSANLTASNLLFIWR